MKNSLVTGGTGFLGRYIVEALKKGGYHVDCVARNPSAEIQLDLSKNIPFLNTPYELVVHCAGKAHSVPQTDEERDEFFSVNVKGTRNLLQGLDDYGGGVPVMIIYISTVAVYGLVKGNNIGENYSSNGSDAYARSKIEAESLLTEWCKRKSVHLIILRLPLIWGLHAPGNLEAMRKAMIKGMYFSIGKGKARKSIVHPADVADLVANIPSTSGVYNLADGHHPTFREIESVMARHLGKKVRSIPYLFALLLAWFGDLLRMLRINFPLDSNRLHKMTSDLTFDDTLARRTLGWKAESFMKRDDT